MQTNDQMRFKFFDMYAIFGPVNIVYILKN